MVTAARRHGFILPVVLVVIGMLALVMAGFMFFVRAEVAGAQAERDALQARLAAQSGLQEVIIILRESRDDPSAWWDVPDRFRNALVWAESYDRQSDPVKEVGTGSREDLLDEDYIVSAWRFSVVAQNHDGLEDTMRFGLTPESGKLNLNAASEDEITWLLDSVLLDLGIQNSPELVDALLDWLDADEDMRPNGAESDYYEQLEPGYYAKNGRLDTLEELLLVRGFTAAVLYGEDTNRNGILDLNEDDGEDSFPYYDNADGILDYGLAPYVTVWSRELIITQGTGEGVEGEGEEGEGTGGKEEDRSQDIGDEGDTTADDGFDDSGDEGAEEGGPAQSGDADTGAGAGEGLINVNTAPIRVLAALDGLTEEDAEQIVAFRREQEPEALQTTEWLVSSGTLEPDIYEAVKDRLTAQAFQFHVEIIGYADHTKLARRYEWIVEARGPIVQVLYHRDLTKLGFAWPVDNDMVVVERQ
ncbi:MAG: general secretion pathway protein GspK [Phycisphaerae bacterium]|nr:general secretion pathway protein GspK [Phycisphaerae bacterium]